MKSETKENIKQFRNANDLYSCVINKYKESIDNFIEIDGGNNVTYKVPIIVDVLQDRQIVFEENYCPEKMSVGNGQSSSQIYAVCKSSLLNFLSDGKPIQTLDLDILFNKLINENNN